MSNYISAENLGHSFHDHWLFKNTSIGISRGRRLALVGINGAGKSTLLKILSGQLAPTEGKVANMRGLKIGYLDQDPGFKDAVLISDYIFHAGDEQQQLIKAYEMLLEDDPNNDKAIGELMEKLSAIDAWEYEYKVKTILGRLDIHHLDQPIQALSGGQKKRLALAKLLIDEPDLYVLDEPTNHLDIETIEWLEKLLTDGSKTILMVTHDRYFLDNVCNEIVEIDRGKLYPYAGNYGYYLEKKAERESASEAAFQKNSNLLRKELEWMRRQPQARGTKSKARIDAYYDLEEKTKNGGLRQQVELSVKTSRQGNKIMEIDHLSKSFNGKPVISDFSYIFKKGDRIGLAGKNGSGKSTLLNLLTGELNPDGGKVDRGETTVIGYFHQSGIKFNEADRVIDVVKNVAEFITMADGKTISASALLTLFLFPPAKQHGFISKLSGGEKKRLLLMQVLMKNPNFLILDEPTNDLDIDTLNVLEEFLSGFKGILLLVSHDRYLLDKLTDQLFIMEERGQIRIYNGNYSAYRYELDEAKQQVKKAGAEAPKIVANNKKSRLSYKEEKELQELEKDISNNELRLKELNERLNTTGIDNAQLSEILNEISHLKTGMDEKSLRWLELSDLKES